MKNLYLAFIALFLVISVQAQQFSFKLYISDSLGHADTLMLGYDTNATDSIDASFGEVEIINQTWDTVFEARICPYDDWGFAAIFTPKTESKKQIMHYNPQPPYSPYQVQSSETYIIEIKSPKQRPFYLTWDSTLFKDSAVALTYLMPLNAVVCPWIGFRLIDFDSISISKAWPFDNSYYLRNNDTIWVMAFQFISRNTVGMEDVVNAESELKVFPNPAKDFINFNIESINQESELIIYNSLGQLIKRKNIRNSQKQIKINISDLITGIYYYQLIGKDKSLLYSGNILKE